MTLLQRDFVSATVIQSPLNNHSAIRIKQVKVTPPPIGCAYWPAGRVLLQWAVDGGIPPGSTTLELGSGIGTTAVGLAIASTQSGDQNTVIATDVCEASLDNLRLNAVANGFTQGPGSIVLTKGEESIIVSSWDASAGVLDQLPVAAEKLTHIIGADLVYHGGAESESSANVGLVRTLEALLQENPKIQVTLLLVDRFSGAAVSALSQVVGVQPSAKPPDIDPEISKFERRCLSSGLKVSRMRLQDPSFDALKQRVMKSQSWIERIKWAVCGYWEGLILYKIRA
eukprot:CAMPEP_0184307840 /NCGR_PEP_ID=MMETSP1049-20130417/16470_1 /TAXON_ID=77928 /ORGANISM="Proteomonas sulcata, Strain CCMP704" /LENGTH=283 /DNA_ID=CAMNT_0026620415 /DNA_START=72 /DNA_END=924 /DNA_ORIENTATION=+